jgi:CheY-like chemotaxis protein
MNAAIRKVPNVLIVDDESDIRDIIVESLGNVFKTIIAGNGSEALQKYENQEFDLILTDLMMPKIDGVRFVQMIRSFEENKKRKVTPIVVVTGNPELFEKSFKGVPFIFLLAKPFSTEEMIAKIKDALTSYAQAQKKPTATTAAAAAAPTAKMIKLAVGQQVKADFFKDSIYLVAKGQVHIRWEGGAERLLLKGDVLGDWLLFDEGKIPTIKILEEAEVVARPRSEFLKALEDSSPLVKAMVRSAVKGYHKVA